ncbi:MAG: ATP-binding protein [Polyangiales bacterium]
MSQAVAEPDDRNAFENELGARNETALRWAHLVFTLVFLAWWALDWYAAPQSAGRFLRWRLAAVAVNTVIVLALPSLRGSAVSSGARMFAWFSVWGAAVASMLPFVPASAVLLYVVGLSVIGFGAAVLPFWPARWSALCTLSIGLAGALAMSIRPDRALLLPLEAAVVYGTVGAGGTIIAVLKQRFFRADFDTRMALSRKESELSGALDELRRQDQEKTRLFHNISHELRTPLTTILAPLDDLVNGGPYRKDDIRMMRRNARRLLRLVDDILELSKLDGGGIKLSIGRVNVSDLVEGVCGMLAPGAGSRNIELTCRGVGEPIVAYVDAYRVETILTNLIGNAVKYTPKGGSISVSLSHTADSFRVSVQDTGPGVPEEMRRRIFERYVQVGEKALGGVGIGLALARELVELHEGEIGVETPEGGGSIFSFALPTNALSDKAGTSAPHRRPREITLRTSEEADTGAAAQVHADGTVLVVDDEPDIRTVIADAVRRHWNVIEAEDGVQALQLIRTERPDVVLADMMMPRMDGATLLREVRGDPRIAHTPVVVLTAAGGADWETAILASGADDYLSKPFSPNVLLARVRLQMRIRGLVAGLANQEKLAAIGTLTAGILHEVNNPAGCIVAASTLIKPETAPPKLQIAHDTIRDAAARIVKLTAALRSHARPDEHDTAKPFNLKEGIESSMALLAHTIKGRTEVVVECDPTIEVFGPPASLNHVFLNLVDNASKSGASRVTLTAELREDGDVQLVVHDDGPGVPDAYHERIFNPFFTTREVGEGTGLGLFLCRKTLLASGGRIELSRSSEGARFVLTLKRPPREEPVRALASERPSVPPAA